MISSTYTAIVLAGIIALTPGFLCQQVVFDIVLSNSKVCSPSCLTLSEFANMSSQIAIGDDTALILESGDHSLSSFLTIQDVTSFSIFTQTDKALVTCHSDHSAGFRFVNITSLMVTNITFSGCGSIIYFKNLAVFELHYIASAIIKQCNLISSKGQVFQAYKTCIKINATSIINSSCDQGVTWFTKSKVIIENSLFLSNTANNFGVVHAFNESNLTIIQSRFENNSVKQIGIIQLLLRSKGTFMNIEIIKNKCYFGILHIFESSLECHGSIILSRNVGSLDTAFVAHSTLNFTSRSELSYSYNHGTILIINSKTTFSGSCIFSNNIATKRGGAIAAIQSSIHFNCRALFHNNSADYGGAVSAFESEIEFKSGVHIYKNLAHKMGGGVFLFKSDLICQDLCLICENIANYRGGGIYAFGSSVLNGNKIGSEPKEKNSLLISGNAANYGGGLSLEAYSKLYGIGDNHYEYEIKFIGNNASCHGGAIYVNDKSNSLLCANTEVSKYTFSECFLQTLYFSPLESINFIDNTALGKGSVLYGGFLDRCTVSIFSHIYEDKYLITRSGNRSVANSSSLNGLRYFQNVTNITDLETIASSPVRICFCLNEVHDCGVITVQTVTNVTAMKGVAFNISLVAVDHVERPVNATIVSKTQSMQGYISGSQRERNISNVCTNMTFNVFSYEKDCDSLIVYADGPCKDKGISSSKVNVYFEECKCPVGFEQSEKDKDVKCDCVCHHDIKHLVTKCNQTTKSFFREDNIWINYVNNHNGGEGYVTYTECPIDYCCPSQPGIWINLNIPNGEDKQCAEHRTGMICGMCNDGYSLSVGSSKCMTCSDLYPLFTFLLILGVLIFGIVLVFMILALNITVATGTINGILFYANIVFVNRQIFLPFLNPNLVTIFISWLNLGIGFDACFYKGMDEYIKTWLLFAFPIYLISIFIAITLLSRRSSKFANIIGKKDPIATLATLILLSYTRLMRTVIRSLAFTVLKYPDGSRDALWYADANIRYIWGKHFPLFLMALITLIICLAYTTLLFSWQWLIRLPKTRVTRWIRNPKLISFISTYQCPFTSPFRYWSGLLLLGRVALYLMIDYSDDPSVHLLGVTIFTSGLLVLKSLLRVKVYRKKFIDYIDTVSILNLLIFCLVCFYAIGNKHANNHSQQIATCISVAVAFATFVTIIVYHLNLIIPLSTCINVMTRQRKRLLDNAAEMTKITSDISTTEVRMSPEQCQEIAEDAESGSGNTDNVTNSKVYCHGDSNDLREPLLV